MWSCDAIRNHLRDRGTRGSLGGFDLRIEDVENLLEDPGRQMMKDRPASIARNIPLHDVAERTAGPPHHPNESAGQ
jgi:hypothetical protein